MSLLPGHTAQHGDLGIAATPWRLLCCTQLHQSRITRSVVCRNRVAGGCEVQQLCAADAVAAPVCLFSPSHQWLCCDVYAVVSLGRNQAPCAKQQELLRQVLVSGHKPNQVTMVEAERMMLRWTPAQQRTTAWRDTEKQGVLCAKQRASTAHHTTACVSTHLAAARQQLGCGE